MEFHMDKEDLSVLLDGFIKDNLINNKLKDMENLYQSNIKCHMKVNGEEIYQMVKEDKYGLIKMGKILSKVSLSME